MSVLSNIKRKVKQRVEASDNQSADDESVDQLEARKERARIEARREARKAKREREIERAREQAREDVETDDKRDAGLLDRVEEAIGGVADELDVDDDGVPLADELDDPAGGSQPASGQRSNFERDFTNLERRVQDNEEDIDRLLAESEDVFSESGRVDEPPGGDPFGGDPFGDEAAQLEAMGFENDEGVL
jgi:hypothetical protein